jgi:hypothetical protein
MKKTNLLLMTMLLLTSLGFSQVNTQNETSNSACDGAAILITSSNYTTWTWYDTDGTTVLGTDIDTISNLCNGVYTVELTDTSTWSFSYTIATDNPCSGFSISAQGTNTSDASSCDGSAIANVTGGTAPYTYSWNIGHTTAQADTLCVGTWNVIVQDNNGCADTAYVQIDADTAVNNPCSGFDAFAQTTNNTLSSG